MLCILDTFIQGILAEFDKPICLLFCEITINTIICKLNSPQYNALDDLLPPIVTLFGVSHLGNRAKSVQECLLILISIVAPYAPKVPTLRKKYL